MPQTAISGVRAEQLVRFRVTRATGVQHTRLSPSCAPPPAQPWRDEPWLYEGALLDADELRAFDASPVPVTRSALHAWPPRDHSSELL
jgi:hypothetical protein